MAQPSTSVHKQYDGLNKVIDFIGALFQELWRGIKTRTLPWHFCCTWGVVFALLFTMRLDALLWRYLHGVRLYPFWAPLYWIYAAVWITMGFWLWALKRTVARYALVKRLTQAFRDSGLVTSTGRVPGFISDGEMDKHLRKLVVTSVSLPVNEFEKAKPFLSSALQVQIDEIRAHVERGVVEILYAYSKLDSHVEFDLSECTKPLRFKVGQTRSGPLYVSLKDVPHILVGGYTNSGKSSFLRETLTTLTVNSPDAEFSMIDLKGGLELGIFEGLPNVRVLSEPLSAIKELEHAEAQVSKRMALLKANKANDLDAFFRVEEGKRVFTNDWPKGKKLSRLVIVIDEAAQLFMASASFAAKDAQVAKRLVSKIAALGRAVGIHLIVATQRPDRNAVDPLIKTNLQGRLCFQMADNASSMTILDSVRAADLPPTKGRAIWRNGLDLIEVQVPWLSQEAMEPILAGYRTNTTKVSPGQSQANTSAQRVEQVSVAPDEIDLHEQEKNSKYVKCEMLP